MADVRPFRRRTPGEAVIAATLVARVSVQRTPARWEPPADGVTLTMRDAIAFRLLGETADEQGGVDAAVKHYQKAVDLWWLVGCRRRLGQLRKAAMRVSKDRSFPMEAPRGRD